MTKFDWVGADYNDALDKLLSVKYRTTNLEPILLQASEREDFQDLIREAGDIDFELYLEILFAGYDPEEGSYEDEEYGTDFWDEW